MKIPLSILSIMLLVAMLASSCKKDNAEVGKIDVSSCTVGDIQLNTATEVSNVPLDQDFVLKFSAAIDTTLVKQSIQLKDNNISVAGIFFKYADNYQTVIVKHDAALMKSHNYSIAISTALKGSKGETFSGAEYKFITVSAIVILTQITIDNQNFMPPTTLGNVPVSGAIIAVYFSLPIDTVQVKSKFTLDGSAKFNITFSQDLKSATMVWPDNLQVYTRYSFAISSSLKATNGYTFAGFSNTFTSATAMLTDDELLTLVQSQTFKYFYDNGHPLCGMAYERNSGDDIVTTGGSGFGVMALIVGMKNGFITRDQGITQLTKIIHFLETCDRFHGAWPHWIYGNTGKVKPFSDNDNGGDLVETSFMIQGLITMRQYLNPSVASENSLIGRITALYNGVEWDWFRQNGQNVLYWHWSPDKGWIMNMPIKGYDEALIVYVLAASSTTHTIPKVVYDAGWASNGGIKNGKTYLGYVLPVGYDYGGPLFFAHYSFLGLDPRHLSDAYANYWTQNMNHSLINWQWCVNNPNKYPNYSASCWGLTASDIPNGYTASSPTNDVGVIAPTAAVSSLPYTPKQSMDAIRYFYYNVGQQLWGDYGFHDAFDTHSNWWASSYLAIDQGPQVVMIENYRTGLLWNLFMSAPEVQAGLTKLGFSYSK